MRRTICTASVIGLFMLLTACPSTKPTSPTQPKQTGSAYTENTRWKNLGVSPNGNILNELDLSSIKRQGKRVTFRDKKTVFDPSKEATLKDIPTHKYSLNTWEIDCDRKTFRLTAMTLQDKEQQNIATYTFSEAQIKALPITPNSASFEQQKIVCQ